MNYKLLLAKLIACHHNLRILHWNVYGLDFDPVHQLLGDYYEQLSDFVDSVAELGMQVNISPLGLTEAVSLLETDAGEHEILLGDDKFSSSSVFNAINRMFGSLIDQYDSVIEAKGLPSDIINKLEEQQQWFRLQRDYKNKKRML
jgi:DNA-binding ferritin-like protein